MTGSKIVLEKRTRLRHLPGRVATGAFILNEGVAKFDADDETAKKIHSRASDVYPAVGEYDPQTFTRALGTAEVALLDGGSWFPPSEALRPTTGPSETGHAL